jgi:hypothetical protein
MEYRYFYIPETLNLEEVLRGLPQSSSISIDQIGFILNTILRQYMVYSKRTTENGFVRLSSTILKEHIHNYKKVMVFLEKNSIIEVDHSYTSTATFNYSGYSKGYKISDLYQGIVKRQEYSKKFSVKLRKINRKQNKEAQECKELDKWLSDERFKLDYNKAMNTFSTVTSCESPNNQKIMAYSYMLTTARDKSVAPIRDKTSGRYHSYLTNFKKDFKRHFEFDGQNLVQIDVINCQLYLLQILLSKDKLKEISQKLRLYLKRIHSTSSILKFLSETSSKKASTITSLIMLAKTTEVAHNEDVKKFRSLVNSGQFYEYFLGASKNSIRPLSTRKEAKIAMFVTLFSDNRFINASSNPEWDASNKIMFKKIFPTVYMVIQHVKKNDKSRLAVLLQALESYIIIEIVCKRITKERPQAPIYTIHDSVSSTAEHIEYIRMVMEEEFRKIVGVEPKLDISNW